MTSYNFTTPEAQKLWDRASPVGDKHKAAWAWRENPAAVDRAWTKATRKLNEEQVGVLFADCMISAEIQSRYRGEQIKTGERLGRPVGLAVWINNGKWCDEVGSTSELKQKQESKICSTQGCERPIHGPSFLCCQDHLPDSWAADRRSHAVERGFAKKDGESKADWIGRLRCIARSTVRGIG